MLPFSKERALASDSSVAGQRSSPERSTKACGACSAAKGSSRGRLRADHALVRAGQDPEVEAARGAVPREKAHHRSPLLVDGREDRPVAGGVRVRQRGHECQEPVFENHDCRVESRAVVLTE